MSNNLDTPFHVWKVFATVDLDEDGSTTVHLPEDKKDRKRTMILIEKHMRKYHAPLEAIEEVGGRLTVQFAPQGYDSYAALDAQEHLLTAPPPPRIVESKFQTYVKSRAGQKVNHA